MAVAEQMESLTWWLMSLSQLISRPVKFLHPIPLYKALCSPFWGRDIVVCSTFWTWTVLSMRCVVRDILMNGLYRLRRVTDCAAVFILLLYRIFCFRGMVLLPVKGEECCIIASFPATTVESKSVWNVIKDKDGIRWKMEKSWAMFFIKSYDIRSYDKESNHLAIFSASNKLRRQHHTSRPIILFYHPMRQMLEQTLQTETIPHTRHQQNAHWARAYSHHLRDHKVCKKEIEKDQNKPLLPGFP